MNCVHPITVGGRSLPCGHCVQCRISRKREWSVRLWHELSSWQSSTFLTLTYDDKHLPIDNSLSIRDLQLFIKRLRRDVEPQKIKYYACGEYGDKTKRPHYHAIIYGLSPADKNIYLEAWGQGFVYTGNVTTDSINYVAGYVMKKYNGEKLREEYGDRQSPFQKCSQGLGRNWLDTNCEQVLNNLYVSMYGQKLGIPRYYRKCLGERLDVGRMDDEYRRRADERYRALLDRGVSPLDLGQRAIDKRQEREEELNSMEARQPKGRL